MKSKQIFIADDGTEFDSEKECQLYETVSEIRPYVTQFVEEHYQNNRLTSKHTNVIMTWEVHREKALAAELKKKEETEQKDSVQPASEETAIDDSDESPFDTKAA
jgi:hypothetical protein